jgi:sirohydrochlorin ferrochelatase
MTTLDPHHILNAAALEALGLFPTSTAVIIVDHGSRRAESNELLLQVVALFRQATGLPMVEAAHMELAEPSIRTAFDRAVQQGARWVVVHPYFLAPGRHWRQDIPQLVAEAAAAHPGVKYLVTAPLGLHPLMPRIMQDRVLQCLRHALQAAAACEMCADEEGCRVRPPA